MNELVKSLVLMMITNPVYLAIVVLGILSAIFYKKIIGYMGEFWVKKELKRLPSNEYIVLNDIMIESNGTHQVDHIVLSKYGIFVIETKNYYGLIVGKEHSDKWVQCLGKNKYYFKNPIHQNYGHIKSLCELLNLDEKLFISIVCVSNRAKLRVETKSSVVQLDSLIKLIKSYKDSIINKDILFLSNKLRTLNIKDKKQRKEHVKNIRRKIYDDKIKEDNMLCPKCGGNLLIRNGKYGEFIGCSNYPKCKYIKKS